MIRALRRSLRNTRFWQVFRPAWWEFQRFRYPNGRKVRLNGVVDIRVGPAVNLNHPTRPTYEKEYFTRFFDSIKSGDVVFDVGANQGIYTIPAAKKVGSAGRVFAFEPSPRAVPIIIEQARINRVTRIVHPVVAIVGDTSGDAFANLHIPGTAAGWASTKEQHSHTSPLIIPRVSLDDFAGEKGLAPNVIKIDVEGAELDVLRGAAVILKKHKPTVFCAIHAGKAGPDSAFEFMKSLGYVGVYTQRAAGSDDGDLEVIFSPTSETAG